MSLRDDMVNFERRLGPFRRAMQEATNKLFDQWLSQQNFHPGDTPMTKVNLTVEMAPPGDPNAVQVRLKLEDRVLDPALYSNWMQAGHLLHSLDDAVIPEGNFALWQLWSKRWSGGMTTGDAQLIWDSFPKVEAPHLCVQSMDYPKPADKLNEMLLAKTTRNAVALILDKYTVERNNIGGILTGDELLITDVAELQRELVELVEAAKG